MNLLLSRQRRLSRSVSAVELALRGAVAGSLALPFFVSPFSPVAGSQGFGFLVRRSRFPRRAGVSGLGALAGVSA